MTSVGDALAVLGLFERIAVELRNYKHAPAHFQNLGVELDLVQSTIRQVLALEPKDGVDRDLLQRIRAIALHCQPALQAFSEKMRTKESSLGALRNTKSLSSIGRRLHWSMIEAKDVHDLRQTVLAEMGAIPILMSASQLKSIHHLSSQIASINSSCGSLGRTCEDIRQETSGIAQVIAQTPSAFSELRRQSEQQHLTSQIQADALGEGVQRLQSSVDGLAIDTSSMSAVVCRAVQSMGLRMASLFEAVAVVRKLIVLLASYSARLVVAVGRNTAMLLDVANQLKIITRAIENIPLHLTLPLVRLDDALGEPWALPFQACTTYNAFLDILKCVVFANNRRGLTQVVNDQFSLTLAGGGTVLTRHNWQRFAKERMHIKQAVIVTGANTVGMDPERCPYPGCGCILPMSNARIQLTGKECPTCGRWSKIRDTTHSIYEVDETPSENEPRQNVIRPEPPSAQLDQDEDEWVFFTRIEVELTHLFKNKPSKALQPAAEISASYVPLTAKALRDATKGAQDASIRSNNSCNDNWSNAATVHDLHRRSEDHTFKVSGAATIRLGDIEINCDGGEITFSNPPQAPPLQERLSPYSQSDPPRAHYRRQDDPVPVKERMDLYSQSESLWAHFRRQEDPAALKERVDSQNQREPRKCPSRRRRTRR